MTVLVHGAYVESQVSQGGYGVWLLTESEIIFFAAYG